MNKRATVRGGGRDHVDDVLDQWAAERPDLDASPMGVLGRLSRLERVLEPLIAEVTRSRGLGGGEFDLLATLLRSGHPYALTPGRLGASSMVSGSAVTAQVDRLEAKGLVERAPDPTNRLSLFVRLTDPGVELISELVTEHVANEHRLLEALSAGERQQLAALLRTLLLAHGDEGLT